MSRTIASHFSPYPLFPPDGLRVDANVGDDEVVLRVCGEADVATAPLLRQALTSALESNLSCPRVVLNFEELRFIDAHCLGIIGNAHSTLSESGRNLVVRSPAPFTRRVLGICGMDVLIEI